MMDECRLHRIDRNLLKVSDGQIVILDCQFHLLGYSGVTHQAVVTAKEYPELVSE